MNTQHARFASQHLFEPGTLWDAAFARLKHDGAAADHERLSVRSPILDVAPSFCLPPVDL